MTAIRVEHLKYRYPGTKRLVLDDISFEIEQGEVVGIVGGNGAGKSTLCQALVGLVPQFYKGGYGGKVWIHGMQADQTPVSTICQNVGIMFQNPFNQLSGAKETVYEEICFGLQNLGVPREEMIQRTDEVLELFNLIQQKDQNPFDLSGGQMQRVALASMLVMRPDIIVLDEPTSQLDPKGCKEVFEAFERLKKLGVTIIIVEHKTEHILSACDRVMLLHEGKLVEFDTPNRVFSRNDLEQYGVQVPVCTKICKAIGMSNGDGSYPVHWEELQKESNRFYTLLETYQTSKECVDNQDTNLIRAAKEQKETMDVELKNVSFSYQEETSLLQQFDVVFDSRTTAVIGQNGAGKTTLMKLLKGLLRPTKGNIYYCGTDVTGMSVGMLAHKISYVFQNPDDQIFKYSVLDEIMFGPCNIGMSREQAKRSSLHALASVGLVGYEQKNPYDLELGDRKMIALASVLAMNTDVIILDEPTIGQDANGRSRIKQVISDLRERGKTVIAILHDMDFVAECFERVLVMSEGRIQLDGTPHQVFQNEEVIEKANLELPNAAKLCRALECQTLHITVDDILENKGIK